MAIYIKDDNYNDNEIYFKKSLWIEKNSVSPHHNFNRNSTVEYVVGITFRMW